MYIKEDQVYKKKNMYENENQELYNCMSMDKIYKLTNFHVTIAILSYINKKLKRNCEI